tara:strand:+ start:2349 stop:2810 length:462 start_codon:yes stop_codon:yes gene_type:complete
MRDAKELVGEQDQLSDLSEDKINAVVALMEAHASIHALEQSNLLRNVLEDAATRLQNNGPVDEIAQQLTDAVEASLDDLLGQNVEIEIDDDVYDPAPAPREQTDPILCALYHATRLHDGHAAIQIAGETPSEERKQELRQSLEDLRDALNTHL